MKELGKSKKFLKQFGQQIRKTRLKLGLSQEVFAEKADIHRTYVSSIELGKVDIGLGVAHKLSQALNTPLSKIVKSTERKI